MSYPEGGDNETVHEDYHIPLDTIPAMVFMAFILTINGYVVFLIAFSSNLRSTSNTILASLAVSDFLVGFVGIPLLVACSSTYLSSVCMSSSVYFTFISISTVLHVTIITCDRYFYIMWALRYRDIVQSRRVRPVIALTWLISLTSLVRLSWMINMKIPTNKEDLALVQEHETTYLLVKVIVFFFCPLVVVIILDVRMVLLLVQQYQKIARDNLPSESVKREKKTRRRQKRAVLRCILLLLLYVIFWLPYFILELMQQNHPSEIPENIVIIIYYLRLCPSLFNPLAYALRKEDVKRGAKGMFFKLSTYRSKDVFTKVSMQRTSSNLGHVLISQL